MREFVAPRSFVMRGAALKSPQRLFQGIFEQCFRIQKESAFQESKLITKHLKEGNVRKIMSILCAEQFLMEMKGRDSEIVLDYLKRWLLMYWYMEHPEGIHTRPTGCRIRQCLYSRLLKDFGGLLRQNGSTTISSHNWNIGDVEICKDEEEIELHPNSATDRVPSHSRLHLSPDPIPSRASHSTSTSLSYSMQRFLADKEDGCPAVARRLAAPSNASTDIMAVHCNDCYLPTGPHCLHPTSKS